MPIKKAGSFPFSRMWEHPTKPEKDLPSDCRADSRGRCPEHGNHSPHGCGELHLPVKHRAVSREVVANKAEAIQTIGRVYRKGSEAFGTQRGSSHAALPTSIEARPCDLPPET